MSVLTGAGLDAIRDQLLAAVERERAPLELTAHAVRGEPITFADAMRHEYRAFNVGDRWGPPWSTTWFHIRGRVPEAWTGQPVVAVFDIGFVGSTGFTCEALAWKDGKPWRGVDPNHRWLPVNGSEVDFYVEAAAIPTAIVSGPDEAPSMIALRELPDPAFVFRQAELRIQDPNARKLALDFKVLVDLAVALPEGWKSLPRPTITQRSRRRCRGQAPHGTSSTPSGTHTSTPHGCGRSARHAANARARSQPRSR